MNLSGELFNRIQITLDSVVISSPSGEIFNSNLFQDKGFYRIRSSENFHENDSIMVSGLFKYKLINDTIDFIYPEQIGSLNNQFYVNNAFTTVISKDDFSASYPIPRQRNFLIDEFDRGGFQFNSLVGIEEYFDASRNYNVLFIKDNDTLKTTADWNETDLTFKFDLPSGLETYSIYNYQIVDNSVSGLLFSDHFKTSKYRTFAEKTDPANLGFNAGFSNFEEGGDLPGGLYLLLSFLPSFESIDKFETFGSKASGVLIELEGQLDRTDWYLDHIYPVIYENYNSLPFEIDWRDEETYGGVPPKAAMYTVSFVGELSDEEINTNQINNPGFD